MELRKSLLVPKERIAVRLDGGHVGLDVSGPVKWAADKGATKTKEVFEAALLVRPIAGGLWEKGFLLRMQMIRTSEKRKHLRDVHDHVIGIAPSIGLAALSGQIVQHSDKVTARTRILQQWTQMVHVCCALLSTVRGSTASVPDFVIWPTVDARDVERQCRSGSGCMLHPASSAVRRSLEVEDTDKAAS